ncbi:MAG TPA: aminotransferase class I/II-fold pyridoxal phosphate-dependent enzyme [Anaerovoracaceae bacterium]|nr:aminotransferase class I/II-fold pyridoxal phosphate-dependent enzyme [Anaerovoracaceae bacterium]
MKFNTALLHGNFSGDPETGATLTPIYQSSAFAHADAEKMEAIFRNRAPGFSYTRINNPTVEAFEKRMAALEGGVGAVACTSGMAAITLAILNLVESGDEIVSSGGVFGGTLGLFHDLEALGIETKIAASTAPEAYGTAVTDKTKLIFVETIGNPKLDVPDISAIAEIAHTRGIPLIVDNTVATPFLIRPGEYGADIVVHSVSKYINGSGNSIGGVIIDTGRFQWSAERHPGLRETEKLGRFAYLAKLRTGLFRNFGSCFSPFGAYLSSLGLETLGIRMERLCSNAALLAEHLSNNLLFSEGAVNYPGLTVNPWHETAKKQFRGGYGALLTLRAGSKERAFRLINALKLAANVSNIGDTRTLVIHPASTIYAFSSSAQIETAGVYDDLIRISVGLEDIEDLRDDFDRATKAMNDGVSQ